MATWEQYQEARWDEELAADEQGGMDARADWALIPRFEATLRKAATTRHKYTRCLYEFSNFLALSMTGEDRLIRAERSHVVDFLLWLEGKEAGLPWHLRGGHAPVHSALAPSTVKGYLSALRAFYYFALEARFIEHDPTSLIRSPTVEHKKGMTLDADELQRFLDAPGNERDRIQAYLLVFTAARAGEVCGLRWQNVNIRDRELTLVGKGKKENVVPIHDELLGALARWRHYVEQAAQTNPLLAAALYDEDTRYVLLTRTGRPVTVQTLGKQVKWRAARAGLRLHTAPGVYHENKSKVHPHALRRSWATLQRRRGVAIEDIAEVLNHASTDTTRKHYAFPATETKRRVVRSFALGRS